MVRTLQLSLVARLSLALAAFLALLAAGALLTARGGAARPVSNLTGRAGVAGLDALQPDLAYAQAIGRGTMVTPTGIVVVGDGEASATPDVAHLMLGVQTEAPTAREAMDRNASTMATVIDAVKQAGIPERDLQTTGINLSPVYSQPRPGDQTSSPPQIIGYRASNTIAVKASPVTKAGEVLDAAVAAGANVAGGIRFAIRDDAVLRRSALEAAARESRTKAETLAAALGVRITGIQSVVEITAGTPVPPVPLQAEAARAATPVQPGELTIRARVQVTYSFA